jgi:hypothetical protein
MRLLNNPATHEISAKSTEIGSASLHMYEGYPPGVHNLGRVIVSPNRDPILGDV